MRGYTIAIACLLSLGACAQTPTPLLPSAAPDAVDLPTTRGVSPISQLAAFTLGDLQSAEADAATQNPPDQAATQCYGFLITNLTALQAAGSNAPKTVGAFYVFQKARDVANGFTGGGSLLKQLNLNCAALVTDVNFTLEQLGIIGAGAAATGGATFVLPVP